MKIFQTLHLVATIILLCAPVYLFSQSKTRTTIVNGEMKTVTIDSLTAFKEDSVLKNTYILDFYGDSTSMYERRLDRVEMEKTKIYVAKLKVEENKKKQEQERRGTSIRLTLLLTLGFIPLFFSYLVYGEYNGSHPNSFGRGFLEVSSNTVKLIQHIKKRFVKQFKRPKCPFCKSSIKAKATVCKHCLRNITH